MRTLKFIAMSLTASLLFATSAWPEELEVSVQGNVSLAFGSSDSHNLDGADYELYFTYEAGPATPSASACNPGYFCDARFDGVATATLAITNRPNAAPDLQFDYTGYLLIRNWAVGNSAGFIDQFNLPSSVLPNGWRVLQWHTWFSDIHAFADEVIPSEIPEFPIGAVGGDTYHLATGFNSNSPSYRMDGQVISVRPVFVPPEEHLENLTAIVLAVNLQEGISNSLDTKLDAALDALDDVNENNDAAAVNSLYAFCNSVNAQRGKKITDVVADDLIAAANQVILSLDEGAVACE